MYLQSMERNGGKGLDLEPLSAGHSSPLTQSPVKVLVPFPDEDREGQ